MTRVAALALLAGGLVFTAVAAVGLYRLPDVYSRAHATSKSETLGALLALGAAGLADAGSATTPRLAALALFLLVTGPTAAHAVVRSAEADGVEPWANDGEEGEA
ncbi:monovalent cation/H(+) antiporter subunit G [Halosimplex amylolyticum]|uniref:monovalent cation/H(+) antiporter subunit G n=1 Tax=Halosimplex amylolyticum TaxID=3396616 RepID=UPI003F55CFF6